MDKAGFSGLSSLFLSSLLMVGPTNLESVGLVCGEALPDIMNELGGSVKDELVKIRAFGLTSNKELIGKVFFKYMSAATLYDKRIGMTFAPLLEEYCSVKNWGFGNTVKCNFEDKFILSGKVFLYWGTVDSWSLRLPTGKTINSGGRS
jgi:hypothetical protein